MAAGSKKRPGGDLAAFDFPHGALVLTEAGAKRRASLHVLSGEEALRSMDSGGIDVFSCDINSFRAALTAENHTLKRALTDPRLVSGIGNAYSDEILHAAQLSPITLTHKLKPEEWQRLFTAIKRMLELWIDRLRTEAEKAFPERSQHFAKTWQSTGAMENRVRGVATKFCGFAMPTRKQTIALDARRVAKSWRIEACPACWDQTGHAPWKSWKR